MLGGNNSARAIDIEDERNKAKMAGYDIIYEARELELPQDVRDGLKQVGLSFESCIGHFNAQSAAPDAEPAGCAKIMQICWHAVHAHGVHVQGLQWSDSSVVPNCCGM